MPKLWKKEDEIIFNSPKDIMGVSGDLIPSVQNFLIKKYSFTSLSQIKDIKNHLLKKKILILDAEELFGQKSVNLEDLKKGIEELKEFLSKNGGSMGRIGDKYLILTPNSHVKISN